MSVLARKSPASTVRSTRSASPGSRSTGHSQRPIRSTRSGSMSVDVSVPTAAPLALIVPTVRSPDTHSTTTNRRVPVCSFRGLHLSGIRHTARPPVVTLCANTLCSARSGIVSDLVPDGSRLPATTPRRCCDIPGSPRNGWKEYLTGATPVPVGSYRKIGLAAGSERNPH